MCDSMDKANNNSDTGEDVNDRKDFPQGSLWREISRADRGQCCNTEIQRI